MKMKISNVQVYVFGYLVKPKYINLTILIFKISNFGLLKTPKVVFILHLKPHFLIKFH